MTTYFNINTLEYPRYIGDVLIAGWDQQGPLPAGWVEVIETPRPEVAEGQVLETGLPALREDGRWYEVFSARDMTPEEIAFQVQVAEFETARKARFMPVLPEVIPTEEVITEQVQVEQAPTEGV